MLVQGYPATRAAWWIVLTLAPWSTLGAAAAPCEPLPLQALAPGLWLVPAAGEATDGDNRGHSSHLLLARDGTRLWAVGSGPTPVGGARLRCTAEQRLGQAPTDAWVPWAHAELALGARGLAAGRHWAHAQVAAAMAEQCASCVERLRQRLGEAGVDLGDDPVQRPTHELHGASGRLGPFDWWVLARAEARVVTVLRHRASGVMSAHGLLWGDGPPDLRDTDPALMSAALQRLQRLGRPGTRWVGESGALLDARALRAQADYVGQLRAAARQAAEQGLWSPAPPPLRWQAHPRHALNWQRALRQAEDDALRGPHFQRSLR